MLTRGQGLLFACVLGLICWIIIIAAFKVAFAHGSHDHGLDIDNSVTNNYYGNEGGGDACLCVSNGLSDGDMSRALSIAMTAGAHELDWSTTDFQLGVNYALQVDSDEEGAYSVKLGKKWKQLPALFHVTYVPEQGQDFGNWVIFGGTVRF